MPSNYLRKYYLRDSKLAQRALLEFSRAMKSGRLIAFTGAMTTEAYGYGSWKELKAQFTKDAIGLLKILENAKRESLITIEGDADFAASRIRIEQIDAQAQDEGAKLTANVAFSLIEEVIDRIQVSGFKPDFAPLLDTYLGTERERGWPLDDIEGPLSPVKLLRLRTAINFRRPGFSAAADPTQFQNLAMDLSVPLALTRAIGIRRFATLNYDFELERIAMAPLNFPGDGEPFASPFEQLVLQWQKGEKPTFQWDLGSGRIRKALPSGLAIESDILNRERIDRMFEFAIGTDDVEAHIMHMHGRACTPRSMLVSYRDYDRLYRHNDLGRMPFEHARKVLIGGNPILFIGLGMTEAESNRELEDFISNSPYRRVAPTFLLWNTRGAMSQAEKEQRRLDWLHRLGILAIFDDDLQGFNHVRAENGRPLMTWHPPKPKPAISKNKARRDHAMWTALRARRELAQLKHARVVTWDRKAPASAAHAKDRPILRDLVRTARVLPDIAQIIGDREEFLPEHGWRSMATIADEEGASVCFWRTDLNISALKTACPDLIDILEQEAIEIADDIIGKTQSHNIVCGIGASGGGKGLLTQQIIKRSKNAKNKRLFVNGAFSFDSDSMLDGIACFLGHPRRLGGYTQSGSELPLCSRPAFFAQVIGNKENRRSEENYLIVINGMDRFFSTSGNILSAELDLLLQRVALQQDKSNIKWIFLGTERIRRYFTRLLAINEHSKRLGRLPAFIPIPALTNTQPNQAAHWRELKVHCTSSLYMAICEAALRATIENNVPGISPEQLVPAEMRALDQAMDRYVSQSPGAISGDIAQVRTAFFSVHLHPVVLQAALVGHDKMREGFDELATEVLRTLAFIGSPVEFAVLLHAPNIRRHRCADHLGAVIDSLLRLGLLLKVRPFPDYSFDRDEGPKPSEPQEHELEKFRYALHRSLIRELRFRFGIPLSEAKLSTAFNMSLYVAQPIDGNVPEMSIHDELGELIDNLIGSYLDVEPSLSGNEDWASFKAQDTNHLLVEAVRATFRLQDPIRAQRDKDERSLSAFFRLCRPTHIQALRAALAVVRGFYATTGLLTVDEGDRLIRPERDGVLLEHAERLDTLIDGFGKVMQARACLRKVFDKLQDGAEAEWAAHRKRFGAVFGSTGPFYADELVWLHNERGVVRLAMGDLYEAKRSFTQALKVNNRWVEFDERSHNWRRIRLNQLTVDIEQGDIDVALRKIDEIREKSQGIDLAELSGRDEARKPKRVLLREDRLAEAICTGYEGFCLHLRGHRLDARASYDKAMGLLSGLDELRAQAYFSRLRAEVNIAHGMNIEQKRIELKAAHDLALSGRQLDIAYRIQIAEALAILKEAHLSLADRRRANRMLDDALRYSLQCDAYRVRCEAAMAIAEARYMTGDYEGALANATDALTVAVRYGLELRKMTLRALLGRILASRGHPITAEHLAHMCITVASRQNVQTAIDRGEESLREIPRFSIALEKSDHSGKRDF